MKPVPFVIPEPTRESIDLLRGDVLLEFGVNECPHCQVVQPWVAEALRHHPEVRHMRIEDGKGRRLGRTFGVKLWPALIFMKNGQEVIHLRRPTLPSEVDAAFEQCARPQAILANKVLE
jgi:thioredoxin 1